MAAQSTDDMIRTVQASITVLADLEGQDHTLVLEMAQRMLADILDPDRRELLPLSKYVRHYCDVIDGPDDADPIVADIEREAAAS